MVKARFSFEIAILLAKTILKPKNTAKWMRMQTKSSHGGLNTEDFGTFFGGMSPRAPILQFQSPLPSPRLSDSDVLT